MPDDEDDEVEAEQDRMPLLTLMILPYQGVSDTVVPHIQRFLRDALNSIQSSKMDDVKSWLERIAVILLVPNASLMSL